MNYLDHMKHGFFDELEKIGMEKEALVPAGAAGALFKGFRLGTAGRFLGARAGIGAGAGAGANVLMGDQNKSVMQRAVSGGVVGGLAGGGLAAGRTAWRLGRLANASATGGGMSRASQLAAIKGLRQAGFASRGAGLAKGTVTRAVPKGGAPSGWTVSGKEMTRTVPATAPSSKVDHGLAGWQKKWMTSGG